MCNMCGKRTQSRKEDKNSPHDPKQFFVIPSRCPPDFGRYSCQAPAPPSRAPNRWTEHHREMSVLLTTKLRAKPPRSPGSLPLRLQSICRPRARSDWVRGPAIVAGAELAPSAPATAKAGPYPPCILEAEAASGEALSSPPDETRAVANPKPAWSKALAPSTSTRHEPMRQGDVDRDPHVRLPAGLRQFGTNGRLSAIVPVPSRTAKRGVTASMTTVLSTPQTPARSRKQRQNENIGPSTSISASAIRATIRTPTVPVAASAHRARASPLRRTLSTPRHRRFRRPGLQCYSASTGNDVELPRKGVGLRCLLYSLICAQVLPARPARDSDKTLIADPTRGECQYQASPNIRGDNADSRISLRPLSIR